MMTNRPTYAPERRPGEALDLEAAARELVVYHFALDDAELIARLIDAGAAALNALGDRIVGGFSRHANIGLGRKIAASLWEEAALVRDRNALRHYELAAAADRAEKAAKRAAKKAAQA